MAYTYDDFVTAADKAGLMKRFSQTDLATAQKNPEYGFSMLSLIQDGDKATTPEQRLLTTEAVNQLRKNYGISETESDSFASGEGSSTQDTMNKIENYGPFTYDPEQDASYVNYRAAALRESKRATEDTLARASAATGGVASTAAIVAAQQAADYYNSQIADAGAAFEKTAYQRYLDGLGILKDQFSLQQDQELMTRQNTEALRKQAELMAMAGDFSGYKALGMSDDWIAKMQSAYLAEQYRTSLIPDGYTPTNITGDGYVVIGNSKIPWDDLQAALIDRQIVMNYDHVNKTVTYEYAHPGLTGDGQPLHSGTGIGEAAILGAGMATAGIDTIPGTSPQLQPDGFFLIDGERLSVDELVRKVASGEIVEIWDHDKNEYVYRHVAPRQPPKRPVVVESYYK
ncbi:MAG: hypothetical protein E7448_03755 [Ruminococcaceae bacterium]|nr:hypothetical protein [Oscillospiraceae bacterium]